jgi:hypothetical protein
MTLSSTSETHPGMSRAVRAMAATRIADAAWAFKDQRP